jgi:hypothetical protein
MHDVSGLGSPSIYRCLLLHRQILFRILGSQVRLTVADFSVPRLVHLGFVFNTVTHFFQIFRVPCQFSFYQILLFLRVRLSSDLVQQTIYDQCVWGLNPPHRYQVLRDDSSL